MKIILALIFVLLNLNSYAQAEYSNEELMNMNLQSLRADFTKDRAYSTGAGRIVDDMPNAVSLARRAALSDARRGLLILKRELKEGRPRTSDDVSGYVPPVKIISETNSEDIYIVEVEAVLSELMSEPEPVKEPVREPEPVSDDKKEVYEVYESEYDDEEEEEEGEEDDDIKDEHKYEDYEDDDEYFPSVGSLLDMRKSKRNRR